MTLKIDLVRDYAEILRQRLLTKGYPPRAETDEETISRYLNVLHRMIEPKTRQTKLATTFSCPVEHRAGLDALIAASEAGKDLRPWQSTGLEKDQYDDGMLNAWNLHHFHLGTGQNPNYQSYVSRTGPLLYAVVTDQTLYGLAIFDHGGWSMQALLDIVDRDFSELSATSTVTSSQHFSIKGLHRNYTDQETQTLRNAGINVITQTSGGNLVLGGGGGVTLSKTKGQKSLKVTQGNIAVREALKEIEGILHEEANKKSGPDGLECTLAEQAGVLIVRDVSGELRAEFPDIVKPI